MRMSSLAWVLSAAILLVQEGRAQNATPISSPVQVEVDTTMLVGPTSRAWSYVGYDEPNYTYSANGQKLLNELGYLRAAPVYIRTHNLLTSGDGKGSLKWGSTNAYTEDAQGRPVYDWTVVDRIFDAYKKAGVRPLVEIGFMPEALTTGPQPYRHRFPQGDVFTGWTYPPKDWSKWAELVYQFAKHLRARYGDAEVGTWLWEVWNEPDIGYWHGTEEEYFRLYDLSADAVQRAITGATVGGPETTGAAGKHAAKFLQDFLEHCARGKNYATSKTGSPLGFLSFHPKGSPEWVDGHVRMGLGAQLRNIDAGFAVIADFPEFKGTPIILGESDPEGCAACTAKTKPQNGYRNGELYATYTVLTLKNAAALAAERGVNFKGAVTWAFQFDDQPYFEGLRELSTNGIDKPVLNGFRMLNLLSGEQVAVTSNAAISADAIRDGGVRVEADIDVIAARGEREAEVLLMNYHDDDVSVPDRVIALRVKLPAEAKQVKVTQYRVDASHSNSFTAWKSMGSPQSPTVEQYKALERAGQLQMDGAPEELPVRDGVWTAERKLPREGLMLIRLTW